MENKNIVIELTFYYENTGFCQTHYKGKYDGKVFDFIIIHDNDGEFIYTSTQSGEALAPLLDGIIIILNNKKYEVIRKNERSILKEIENDII